MQIKQLQYFVSLCDTLSFTQTAKEFFVSQSAITIQISALEKELGTRLFQRTKRKVELTGAGVVLREEATAILNRLKAAEYRVKSVIGETEGNLRIGYLRGFEYEGVNLALESFHEWFPKVHISLLQGSITQLDDELRRGNLDLCFSDSRYEETEEYESHLIGEYSFIIICRRDHPLASGQTVRPEDLRGYPLVHGEKTFQNPAITGIFSAGGFVPVSAFVSENIQSSILAVEAGYGYTIAASYAMPLIPAAARLSVLPLVGYDRKAEVDICWRKDNPNPFIEHFYRIFRDRTRPEE